VPGLILSAIFVGYIVLRVKLSPALAPKTAFEDTAAGGASAILPVRAAAGVDLRDRGGRDDRRNGRRPPSAPALGAFATIVLAFLYSLVSKESASKSAWNRRDLRHDPVHHRRRHDLLADPVLSARNGLAPDDHRAGRRPWR